MTVMVDELMVWAPSRGVFAKGSCHLTADNLEELHAFAEKLGLRRAWFQNHVIAPHYDLTPNKRALALRRGAVFVPAKEQALARRARKS